MCNSRPHFFNICRKSTDHGTDRRQTLKQRQHTGPGASAGCAYITTLSMHYMFLLIFGSCVVAVSAKCHRNKDIGAHKYHPYKHIQHVVNAGFYKYNFSKDWEDVDENRCELVNKAFRITAPNEYLRVRLSINGSSIRKLFGKDHVQANEPVKCAPFLDEERFYLFKEERRRRKSFGDSTGRSLDEFPALFLEELVTDYSIACLLCPRTQHVNFVYESETQLLIFRLIVPKEMFRDPSFVFPFRVEFLPKLKRTAPCAFKCGATTKCLSSVQEICDGQLVCPVNGEDENPHFCAGWRAKHSTVAPRKLPPYGYDEKYNRRDDHEFDGYLAQVGKISAAVAVAAVVFFSMAICYCHWQKRSKASARKKLRRTSYDEEESRSTRRKRRRLPKFKKCQSLGGEVCVSSNIPSSSDRMNHGHIRSDATYQQSGCYGYNQPNSMNNFNNPAGRHHHGPSDTLSGLKTDHMINRPYSVPASRDGEGGPRRHSSSGGARLLGNSGGAGASVQTNSYSPQSNSDSSTSTSYVTLPPSVSTAVQPPPNRTIDDEPIDRRRP